jgi:hypothetical protein
MPAQPLHRSPFARGAGTLRTPMTEAPEEDSRIPEDVLEWIRQVFANGNTRVTEKLIRNPNLPEESLDLTWIEHLSRFSAAERFPSQWVARIESHYLGGLRHFGSWEIADIGLLVFLRLAPGDTINKVALLQSKRLYPNGVPIREETRVDYEIGLARLADPEDLALSIGPSTEFRFTADSRFGALRKGSNQVGAITDYQSDTGLRVYYQLYNPWTIPFTQQIPLAGYVAPEGTPELGVRVVPAQTVHAMLDQQDGTTPRLGDFENVPPFPSFGWRLEEFVCDELLACREGNRFNSPDDPNIQRLFYRRTGAIAAAISVTVEAPGSIMTQ